MNLYGVDLTYKTPSGRPGRWRGPATANSEQEAEAKVLDQLKRHPYQRRIAKVTYQRAWLLQKGTK